MIPNERTAERDGAASHSSSGPPPGPLASNPDRDFWARLEILARPITSLIAAGIIAGLGLFGKSLLEDQQNSRLYTELLSRREQAESELRTNMFTEAMDDFFSRPDSSPGDRQQAARIEERLLRLEMLALNFGESLSLSPLFLELDRDIQALDSAAASWWRVTRHVYRDRLHSLARRVSKSQLAALAPKGEILDITVPVAEARAARYERGFQWPKEEEEGVVTLNGEERDYRAIFYGADPTRKTVNVRLRIIDSDLPPEEMSRDRPMEFNLSFFDFPMIDNTRLSKNQRFALMIDDWDLERGNISVTGIVFPGALASHRDKPFLTDAIENLEGLDGEESGNWLGRLFGGGP